MAKFRLRVDIKGWVDYDIEAYDGQEAKDIFYDARDKGDYSVEPSKVSNSISIAEMVITDVRGMGEPRRLEED